MAAGYCSVCRRNVRGGYTAHAGTSSHRTALVRAEKGRGNRVVGRIAATRRANAGRSLRTNVDKAYRALTRPIKAHRRRRPNDGPARSVKVTRHYRRRPTSSSWTSYQYHRVGGVWMRVRFVDGVAASMRRATRRELADPQADVRG